MSTLLFIQIVGLIVIGYISIGGIVNRICKCAENCAALKSVGPQALSDPAGFARAVKEMSKK